MCSILGHYTASLSLFTTVTQQFSAGKPTQFRSGKSIKYDIQKSTPRCRNHRSLSVYKRLGPFSEENFSEESYLKCFRNELVSMLVNIFPNENEPDLPRSTSCFQQNDAPPHIAGHVRNY